MRIVPCLFLFLLVIASCTKTETVTVPGNVPPPDHTIDSSTISIYINKNYINMLGRKPVGTEQATAMATLRTHNFSVADRKQFVQTLFSKPEYNRTLYVVANNAYLNNSDSAAVLQAIFMFQFYLTQPAYSQFFPQFNFEITRLDTLQNVVNYLNSGVMDDKAMLKRIANNYIYDEINMGSQNFVTSTYQNFLLRYPTASELTNGVNMVNGTTSTLFLQVGQSKQDYINIFFASDEFIQGQVQILFQNFLFRKPTSAEFGYYSNIYKTSNDYKQLQLAVFSTDEYAGL